MSVQRGLLVIADIGGYTRFMKLHKMSLAHAQDHIARLLEAVIEASPRLRLIELEGDAAFFYLPLSGGADAAVAETVAHQARAMHLAFHARQQEMIAFNMCTCDGCNQMGQLRVKFVAHLGEVATQKVKKRTKLAGLDVIVVHRMLKNSVPVPEYLLMSEPLFQISADRVRRLARGIEQDLEGLGPVQTYFVDFGELIAELPAAPEVAWYRRSLATFRVTLRSLPYLLGVKKPCEGFRNLAGA